MTEGTQNMEGIQGINAMSYNPWLANNLQHFELIDFEMNNLEMNQ